MTVEITIVGLGQIGTSIGLALAEHTNLLKRMGHDRRYDIAKQAAKMGAVDRVSPNLPSSVRDADIVLLAIPMDQIRETLEIIIPDLKEGAVVMDTAPVKESIAAWAGELLPPGCDYVGLTPVINPAYLYGPESGTEAAHADMFRNSLMGIVAPARTSPEAIKLAADLTRLLGASAFFTDPTEMDGLMAATHLLPQMMAAALLNATVDQPGWREGQKLAGKVYAEATNPIMHQSAAAALRAETKINRENLLRHLDNTIAILQAFRSDIQDGNQDALQERLERAVQGRERWWKQRQSGEWAQSEAFPTAETTSSSDVFGRLLGINRRPGLRRPGAKK